MSVEYVDLVDHVAIAAPSTDDAERAVLAIASGEWDHEHTAAWLRSHLVAPEP